MSTYMASASNIERKWYVVDAADYTLGRLASQVAAVLRGKNKPTYTPFLDCGDNVIVITLKRLRLQVRSQIRRFTTITQIMQVV